MADSLPVTDVPPDPFRWPTDSVPKPQAVEDMIARLERELVVARKLLKFSRAAHGRIDDDKEPTGESPPQGS